MIEDKNATWKDFISDESKYMLVKSYMHLKVKKKIERLKLEREFKNLTEDDIAPGRKYVSEILSASGKKALTVAAAGAMTYAVKTAMTKEFNLKEAAQYIAANPNKKK